MIPEISAGDLVARLDAALEQSEGRDHAALVTDGDGTLWTNDVGEALFHLLLEERRIGEPAVEALLREADEHRVAIADRADGTAIARALWDAYLAGAYPEKQMCATITWCMAGMRLEALAEIAARLLSGPFDLPRKLIAESAAVLRWADRNAVPVWLVSASPRTVVDAAAEVVARTYAIPKPTVLAMTPSARDGVICASMTGIWTYGEGKVDALSHALASEGGRRIVAAMGDNVFDAQMLRAACVPVAIRPKKALVDVAASITGLVRVEMRER